MEDSNAMKLMKVGKKTHGMTKEENLNNRFTYERVKTNDGTLKYWKKYIPQYGMQDKTKVAGKTVQTKNEFGDTIYIEYDSKGKELGRVNIVDPPSRPRKI